MLSSFIVGACGAVVAIANVLPVESLEVYETFRSGDWKKQPYCRTDCVLPPLLSRPGSACPV